MPIRNERDSFGTIEILAERLWDAQTQRSLEHFHISSEQMPEEIIMSLAEVKCVCALVNRDLSLLSTEKVKAIVQTADEILIRQYAQEFLLSVLQSGSGTQSHMNMNEVLANRASELLGCVRGESRKVHPNDEVNLGQSSNDIFPTAMHVAAATGIVQEFPNGSAGSVSHTIFWPAWPSRASRWWGPWYARCSCSRMPGRRAPCLAPGSQSGPQPVPQGSGPDG